MMARLIIAVGLLSAALIAFQLVLMQFLSIVQWHHFAYMVISVALLGFGASGTFLALFREWMLKRTERGLPLLMILCGAAMALVVEVSQSSGVRFDSYLLFVEKGQIGRLVSTYLTLFLPFFLGALAVGIVFVRNVDQIGKFYASNLLGSGLGGLSAVVLLWMFVPQELPAVVALLPVLSGLLMMTAQNRRTLLFAGTVALTLSASVFHSPSQLQLSDYKALKRTLNLPDAEIVFERISPYGLLQIVSSPALRSAPGLSLAYQGPLANRDVVFNNADWFGPVFSAQRNDTAQVLRYTTFALPYAMHQRDRVLVLQARTGMFVAQAIEQDASKIVAVEAHNVAISALKQERVSSTDSLFFHPAVSVYTVDPRTFLQSDTTRYDLIVLPTLDAFGGTSGVYALQEQYLLTKEAFREIWNKLTPSGVVCITSWMDYPLRNPLRALATLVETLADEGIAQPHEHIAAVRSWGMVTFVLKRSPLSAEEIRNIRDFCNLMMFDPVLLPDIDSLERNRFNLLQDTTFFSLVDGIVSERRKSIYTDYDFNLTPSTDDRPYFSQFLKWGSIPRMKEFFGEYAFPFLELGSLIIAVTLVQITVVAVLLILLPLFKKKMMREGRWRVILLFGGLGLGYMFVEMVLMQRFILFLGHPIYATAAVISAMLACSGVGSWVSSRLATSLLGRTAFVVALAILVYAVSITPILHCAISFPLWSKVVLTCLLIAPPAFVMGMPFPLGLRQVSAQHEDVVPWAWGINGCMSVIAAPLAVLLAVEIGFSMVMISAAACYGVAGIVVRRP
jgi:hypothetical protein